MKHVIFWSVFSFIKRNILLITGLYAVAIAALILMQGSGQ